MSKDFNPERKFNIAITARYLGHTLQNLDDFNDESIKKLSEAEQKPNSQSRRALANHFREIYSNAKELMMEVGTPEAEIQINEIMYNTERFLNNLIDPNDWKGAIRCADELLALLTEDNLSSLTMKAQTLNVKSIERNKGRPTEKGALEIFIKEQYSDILQANEIAASTKGFDTFLTTMFMNKKLAWALESKENGTPILSDNELSAVKKELFDRLEQTGKDHFYYPYFYMNMARHEKQLGNKEEAMKLLKIADEVNVKCKESNKEVLAFRKKHQLEIPRQETVDKLARRRPPEDLLR